MRAINVLCCITLTGGKCTTLTGFIFCTIYRIVWTWWSRDITHFYCLVEEAGFNINVVECLPLDRVAQVRFPPGAVGILCTLWHVHIYCINLNLVKFNYDEFHPHHVPAHAPISCPSPSSLIKLAGRPRDLVNSSCHSVSSSLDSIDKYNDVKFWK